MPNNDNQTPLFDYIESQNRRDIGIAKVSGYPNDDWITRARNFAMHYAARNGEVTSDDVQKWCPPPPDAHPNVMGAVFRGKRLKPVGFTQTKRVSGHARTIRIYELAGDECQ